ncbi:MAG: hypothetical protein CL609_02585 [Anaerolineaceae bacterium]|nr:hypothetical protein [Anaerolineaceae bacterium]
MNSKEIILANINHTNPPRPGLDFDRGRICDVIFSDFYNPRYSQKRWREGNIEYYDDEWGNLWNRMIDGSFKGEICRPAISDWGELNDFILPDYTHEDCTSFMAADFKANPDKFHITNLGGWIFNDARYLRNMDVYFMDMGLHQEELIKLHNLLATVYEQKIHLAGKIKADAIFLNEDLGTQTRLLFSPKMFRFYFKDLYTRLFSIAHEYGMKVIMHSCGKNWDILPDLLDAGVNVFQFDQPTVYDMPKLAALLKERKAALYSPIDIQKILPSGNQSFIEAGAVEMIQTFNGHLICKNYLDLPGIGVKPEWDDWGYQAILENIKNNIPKIF